MCVLEDYNVNIYGDIKHNNANMSEFLDQFLLRSFTKLIMKSTRFCDNKKYLLLLDNMSIYNNTTLPLHIDFINMALYFQICANHLTIFAI